MRREVVGLQPGHPLLSAPAHPVPACARAGRLVTEQIYRPLDRRPDQHPQEEESADQELHEYRADDDRHGPVLDPVTQRSQARSEQRSEEHTSELQSRENLVCRLLLEKKKRISNETKII